RRVKFKPGLKLAANYDVTLGPARQSVSVAATWFAGDLPASIPELAAASEELRKDAIPTPLERLFAVVPSSRMLVQVAPLDPAFPGLGWLSDPKRAPEAAATCTGLAGVAASKYGVRTIRY